MTSKQNLNDSNSIIRSLEDGFLRADKKGVIIMANEAIAAMCGYASPEEMIGLHMKSLYVNPNERDQMIPEIKSKGKLHNYKLELLRKDGSSFWSLNNIKTFSDEKDNVLGTEGVIRDITQLHETEKKLEHANQQLTANEQQLRASNQQLAANEQQLRAANQQLMALNQQLAANEQQLLANGKKLEKANQFADKIANTTPALVYIYDIKEGKNVWTNDVYKEYFKKLTNNYPGMDFNNIAEFIHEDDFREVVKKAREMDDDPNVNNYSVDIRVKSVNTCCKWMMLKVSTFNRDYHGKLLQTIGALFDISDRKNAEIELEKRNKFIQMILDDFPIGIATNEIDSNKVNYINPKFAEIYGWPKEEFPTTLHFFEKVFPDTDKRIKLQQKIMSDIQSRDLERMNWNNLEITTQKGEKRIVHAINIPLFEQNTMISTVQDVTKQKKAEQELKESEAKFRSYVNNAPDGMFIADETGRYIEVNQAACDITGYSEKELTQKYIPDLLQESEVEKGIKHFKEVQKNKSARCEIGFLTKKGEKCFWQVAAVKLSDTRFLGFVKDVTNRKKVEEELEHSHKLMEYIIEHTNSAVAVHDIDMRYVYVSQQYLDQYKIGKKDIIGRHHYDVFPDLPQKWRDIHQRVLKGEIMGADEDDYRKADGTVEWTRWECRPWYNLKGDINGLVVYTEVITEAKKMQDALKESEAKLKNIIEHSTNLFYSHSVDEKITFISPQVREYLGYEPEEVMQNWTDFITDNPINQKAIEYTEAAIQTGRRQPTYELEMQRKDGRKIIVEVREAPVVENGKTVSIVGSLADITERKKAEFELIKAKEKAEEADRLKSAFLANMSHEIRTPMNGILGFAELLREPDLGQEQQLEYVSIIEKSGQRMLNIINEIIDISKIESGTMEVNLNEVNINAQLDYIFTFFKPEAANKGLELILKNALTTDEANINTDGEKVFAVLINLLKNAIKYTNTGYIEFGCSLTIRKKMKYLQFSVKDSGVGIAIERQDAIFDRFVQADIENINARQGAGLGLAISKAYIEMLGGKLWLESELGKGSIFSFTIPYNQTTEKKTFEKNKLEINNDSRNLNLKVLIAEDDESSMEFISIVLKDYAKEIIPVKTGTEAVEACRTNPDIDLVLMDIQMPEMNGYIATEQIRQFNNDVVIIAQTAYGLTGDREKALDAGSTDYIAKPIKKNKLKALIQNYFK